MSTQKHPTPVDPVYTLASALVLVWERPWRSYVNVVDGQPAMPAPWEPRMRLDGATLFVHPMRERRAIARLNRAPWSGLS
jgi:hypothetical protein